MDKEDIHSLRLMAEIERDSFASQREISHRLGISLGLVNTFLKRFVNSGYLVVKVMPRKRMKYLLTPEGSARKKSLIVDYLRYSTGFYKEIKDLLLNKFREMEGMEKNSILFLGTGEVAELAYLYLQLTDIRLVGVIDDGQNGKDFFGHKVDDYDRLKKSDWDLILLTCLDTMEQDTQLLIERGFSPDRIVTL